MSTRRHVATEKMYYDDLQTRRSMNMQQHARDFIMSTAGAAAGATAGALLFAVAFVVYRARKKLQKEEVQAHVSEMAQEEKEVEGAPQEEEEEAPEVQAKLVNRVLAEIVHGTSEGRAANSIVDNRMWREIKCSSSEGQEARAVLDERLLSEIKCGTSESVQELLRAKADPDAFDPTFGRRGGPALAVAAFSGTSPFDANRTKIVQSLLSFLACVHTRMNFGHTALCVSMNAQDVATAALLLHAKANVHGSPGAEFLYDCTNDRGKALDCLRQARIACKELTNQ
jgi:hypothetical protein